MSACRSTGDEEREGSKPFYHLPIRPLMAWHGTGEGALGGPATMLDVQRCTSRPSLAASVDIAPFSSSLNLVLAALGARHVTCQWVCCPAPDEGRRDPSAGELGTIELVPGIEMSLFQTCPGGALGSHSDQSRP